MSAPPLSLAAIRQPAFLYGPDGTIAAANDRAEALAEAPLAGLAPGAIVALFSVRSRDGTGIVAQALPAAQALAGDEPVDVPLTVTAADGRTVHVLATASPIRDGDAIAGALSIWQDVTSSVEAERELAAWNRELRGREEEIAVQNEELQATGEEILAQNEELRCQADELREQGAALRSSLERLALSQLAARTGFWDWDMPTERLTWSPEFYDLFGLDPSVPPTFETWLAALHPQDRDRAMATITRSVEERTPLANEYRTFLSEGGVRWIGAYGDTTYDHDGRPVRMAGICIDITERKRAEDALAESGERYRSLFENSNDAVFLTEPDGTILAANPEACQIFGMTEEELIGAGRSAIVDPADPQLAAALEERARTGRFRGELRFRRGDGTVFTGEIASATFTGRDGHTRTTMTIRDITERKRTEEVLRETRDYLDNLINYANASIIVWDPEFRITRFNAAFEHLSGHPADEVIGRDLVILFPEESRVESLEKIQRTITERWQSVEIPILRPDGGVRIALWNSANIYDTEGTTLLATIAQGQDITERKEVEEALRRHATDLKRSNEDLERFAYVSSHDLQEPLRAIVSFSQLLERRYRGRLDQDAYDYINFIVEGGVRMQALIQDLLAFSRVNTKRQELRPIDMEEVLASVERNLDVQLNEAGGVLTHDLMPVVLADPLQLEQVFMNLVSNAIKFRKADVPLRIHVDARRLDGFWEFSVADNGIGIEAEYLERIFIIFQRLHTKDLYPGTGIGLAIVKRIIDRHGGKVWVESVPGEGSTFFFTLPAA